MIEIVCGMEKKYLFSRACTQYHYEHVRKQIFSTEIGLASLKKVINIVMSHFGDFVTCTFRYTV